MEQFIPDNHRHRHGREQPGQQINLADEHKVMQRTGVRDDDPHTHKPS
jgi:hypothetical protein